MINLSLDELKLIAQSRNISDYENKSEKDLVKALSKPKPKIRINKKKLEEIRKYFNELRHKFSKKEIDKYRKAFYDIKNYRYLSASEIKEVGKNLNELKKSLRFKKFHGDIDSVDYEDLDNYDDNYDFANDGKYRKIGSVRTLFKEFDRDYYKPKRTDDGFARRRNNYIKYNSKGDRYENLSTEEYLKTIRPYLRDLINDHKPTRESNIEENEEDEENDSDADLAESKIQQIMQNSCISTRNFEETRTIYSASKPVEIFMGSDTEDVIDTLFNTILQRFQQAQETSNDKGSEFIPESVELLYYYFQKINIRRAESYIMSPDWWVNKGATINPTNEKDNKSFQWFIISGLNHNKIKVKDLKKIRKLKRIDTDFPIYREDWENFEQNNTSVALNLLFGSYDSEEIKLA